MFVQTLVAVSIAVAALILSTSGISPEHTGESKAKVTMVAGTTKVKVAPPTNITSKPIPNHLIVGARTTRLPIFFPKGPEHSPEKPTSPSGPQLHTLKKQGTTNAEATRTSEVQGTTNAEATRTSELQVDSHPELEEASDGLGVGELHMIKKLEHKAAGNALIEVTKGVQSSASRSTCEEACKKQCVSKMSAAFEGTRGMSWYSGNSASIAAFRIFRMNEMNEMMCASSDKSELSGKADCQCQKIKPEEMEKLFLKRFNTMPQDEYIDAKEKLKQEYIYPAYERVVREIIRRAMCREECQDSCEDNAKNKIAEKITDEDIANKFRKHSETCANTDFHAISTDTDFYAISTGAECPCWSTKHMLTALSDEVKAWTSSETSPEQELQGVKDQVGDAAAGLICKEECTTICTKLMKPPQTYSFDVMTMFAKENEANKTQKRQAEENEATAQAKKKCEGKSFACTALSDKFTLKDRTEKCSCWAVLVPETENERQQRMATDKQKGNKQTENAHAGECWCLKPKEMKQLIELQGIVGA